MKTKTTLTAIFQSKIHQIENRLHRLARDPKAHIPHWDNAALSGMILAYKKDLPERLGLENTLDYLTNAAYA